jgi:hypothetical protein
VKGGRKVFHASHPRSTGFTSFAEIIPLAVEDAVISKNRESSPRVKIEGDAFIDNVRFAVYFYVQTIVHDLWRAICGSLF